jgi:drug/metabolite transporter (DMT)-like permease
MQRLARHQLLPVLSLLLSATLWGLVWYPLRLLEARGLEGLWLTLTSYGAALAVGLLWAWPSRHDWRGQTLVLVLMGLAAGWCNVAFVLAVLDGTVVRVLLLFYLSPVWTLALGWLLLAEHPGRAGLVVLVLALLGALVMLWNPAMGLPWPLSEADWLAVSSGFAFACSNVLVRKLRQVSIQTKSLVTWLGVVLVAAGGVLLGSQPAPTVTGDTWFGALLLGWFGFMIMAPAVIYGVSRMPVHRSAVILLFELVVGAVSSLLLSDERIVAQEWAGGALILVAAYLAAHAHVRDSR